MIYRTLGNTGWKVSAIGLGSEYIYKLPKETAARMVQAAIDRGINYFDLFYAFPSFRDIMGAAFQGHREKVHLAAHLGSADINGQYEMIRDPKQCEHFFLDFLTRYQTDYVDVLFLHNSNSQEDYDLLMKPGGLLEMALRFKKEGKARAIGFSGHNTITARLAVQSGVLNVLMFPLNFTSHAMPGRKELLDDCVKHNIGLVIMKPFAGGNLLKEGSWMEVVDYQMGRMETNGDAMIFKKSSKITAVQCLAYILDQPAISTIVPGCGSLEQLEDVLSYWTATEAERAYTAVLPDFSNYKTGQCVHCNHCLPCPSNIDIGQTLRLLDQAKKEKTAEVVKTYSALSVNAADCIQCGNCMERCPFGVDVISQMEEAVRIFA
jgi:predicted aldo/keto reductase-like oxidoreductase